MNLLFGGARQRVLAVLLLEPAAGFHIAGKPVVFLMGDKDDLAELAGDLAPAAARC